jgi:hypothetical protein
LTVGSPFFSDFGKGTDTWFILRGNSALSSFRGTLAAFMFLHPLVDGFIY